jgi:N utilization substance protein B
MTQPTNVTIRPRHQARIVVLQALYQLDVQREPVDANVAEIVTRLATEAELIGDAADYAHRLATGAWAAHPRYDALIAEISAHWELARMAVVDRNILRLALHEISEHPDVPVRVVMDEAIELGREFGDEHTPQFINGVLDAIWKHRNAHQAG